MAKNLPAIAGDTRDEVLIPGSGRFPWGGNSNSLQYSCLKNYMDRRAWWAIVYGVTESDMAVTELTYLNRIPHLLFIWDSRVYYVH